MVGYYSKLIFNIDCFLELEITNELNWTKVFLIENDKRLFIGSEEYKTIINKFVCFLNQKEKDKEIQIIAFFETYNTFYYIGNNSFILQNKDAKTIFEFEVKDIKGIHFEE